MNPNPSIVCGECHRERVPGENHNCVVVLLNEIERITIAQQVEEQVSRDTKIALLAEMDRLAGIIAELQGEEPNPYVHPGVVVIDQVSDEEEEEVEEDEEDEEEKEEEEEEEDSGVDEGLPIDDRRFG